MAPKTHEIKLSNGGVYSIQQRTDTTWAVYRMNDFGDGPFMTELFEIHDHKADLRMFFPLSITPREAFSAIWVVDEFAKQYQGTIEGKRKGD